MRTGIVFDVKEFAVYDGPGMRQTVFLKGCPLKCNWCHNPEGLSCRPQLMVSSASCTHCDRCKKVCPHPVCTACGNCIPVCPLHLRHIAGERMTSGELVAKIRKDSTYYKRYGGGVTFSGGEPLMQADFLREVLEAIPDIHRAIETSGYAEPDSFCQVLKHMDFVMLDLKIMDPALHKKYTGADNALILKNAGLLMESDKPFVVRIPVIPGVNDNESNYRATGEFLSGAKKLERVELLPYHKTAGAKYQMLGAEYRPIFDTEQQVHISKKIFKDYGIRSEIL